MLKEKVIEQMDSMAITFDYNNEGDRHSFFFDQILSNGMIRSLIGINNIDDYIISYLMCPTPLPTSKSAKILEYISRVNFEDCFGAFVYNFEDSLVGYQCAFFNAQNMTDFDMHFTRNFELDIDKIDFHIPGLLSVGFGDKEPALAINQLEFEIDPSLN